jgi:ABC-type multidrug transport system permease subunit
MKRLLIALYLICVVLFTVFFVPQNVEVEGEIIGNMFKPIYWNPNKAVAEYEQKQPINNSTTSHYLLISNIDYPKYFICLFVITALFASLYVLTPKKEKWHG